MSDPLTSNENKVDSKSDKIESSGSGSNVLVQLSNKTLALFNQNNDDKNDSLINYESDNEEDEQPYLRSSILSNIFNTKGSSTNQPGRRRNNDPNKQPRRRKPKPLEYASGPSDDQLSAPYIEEHHPEQPDFIRQKPQSETPESDLIREEAGPSNQIKQQLEGEGKYLIILVIIIFFFFFFPLCVLIKIFDNFKLKIRRNYLIVVSGKHLLCQELIK
jgi:hypothetical protein